MRKCVKIVEVYREFALLNLFFILFFQSTFNIDGHTWSLGEIPDYAEYTNTPSHLFKDQFQDPPSIITEHVHPARRFILLSAQVPVMNL